MTGHGEVDRTGDELTRLADLLAAIDAAPDPFVAAVGAGMTLPEAELRVMLSAALVLLRYLLGRHSATGARLLADLIRIRESWDLPPAERAEADR